MSNRSDLMDKLAQIRLISVQQKRSNGQTRVVPHENCPIEAIVKYLVGKTSFDHAIILLTRVGAFYFIGLLIGLDQTNSIVVGEEWHSLFLCWSFYLS